MCGNFFDLQPADTADISAIYDRAALIALPPDMRPSYARRLGELAAPGTSMLLITMEYDQPAMHGPPFSVAEAEVHTLFERGWQIRSLHRADILQAEPRFRAQGISFLFEHVYLLVRRASAA
jgi:thiopurine S-methyltransferase